MSDVLVLDATEDMQSIWRALESAGFRVSYSYAEDMSGASPPSAQVAVLNLCGRADGPSALARCAEVFRSTDAAVLVVVHAHEVAQLDAAGRFDDFFVFPASPPEVVSRVRRAARRRTGVEERNTLEAGALRIDLDGYKAYVDERPVDLTFKEYQLLRFLMTNRTKVFTREALLDRVWGYDFYGGARTVDVHIRRLRSKIETHGHRFIETVRSVGYRFQVA